MRNATLDQAMKALEQLFSAPEVEAKARWRCGINGPTEFDVLFEAVLDDLFGREPNSDYKRWTRRLYRRGVTSSIPDDWKVQNTEGQLTVDGLPIPGRHKP
jgi:hypothetical protein